MNPLTAAHYIVAIKSLTLSVAGIKNLLPADCRMLSFLIIEQSDLGISELTLSRFFGFAASKFPPSAYTLNVLAVYCGYADWEAFCRSVDEETPVVKDISIGNVFDHPVFLSIMNTSVPTVILNTDAPDFTIVSYNNAYERETGVKKRDIRGLTIWKVFNASTAGNSGPALLLHAFHKAINTQKPVHLPDLQYNVLSATTRLSATSWLDVTITPVNYNGLSNYLLIHTYNITDKFHRDDIEKAIMKELTMAENLAVTNVRLQKALETLAESHWELTRVKDQLEELNTHLEERVFDRTKKLSESESRHRELIYHAPVAIAVLRGPDHVIETANKKIIDYWGKTKNVLGLPLGVALPEIEGQSFIQILDKVRATGTPYANSELQAFLNKYGQLQSRYFDMLYHPIRHQVGTTDCIYIIATDITDKVMARMRLEESQSMLQLAVEAANIGIWSFDLKTLKLTYNFIFSTILGWEQQETMTYDQAMDKVTDEFREKLRDVAQKAMASGETYDIIYSQKRFNDDEIIWLRATGKVTANDFGEYSFSGIISQVPNDLKNDQRAEANDSDKLSHIP
jgi:PAS domain S-box-containing protein